jgi:tetratricopeptide (TPR) repeat protein
MSGITLEEVVARYHTLLEEDPTDAMLKFWLAVTLLIMNRDGEAEELLQTVWEVHPDNDAVLSILSDTYVWREGLDKAADYERALGLLHHMRDLRLQGLGELGNEDLDLKSVDWLRIGVPYSFRIGEIALLRGDAHEAIAAYEQSLKLKPSHYNSSYRLGLAYKAAGERERAISHLRTYMDVEELNAYDATAMGREASCGAIKACHSISRPEALANAEQIIGELR